MRKSAIATVLFLLLSAQLHAAGRNLTCYLDGGVVSQELSTAKGYLETALPGSMIPGSLRVKPGRDTVIARVQTVPARVDVKTEKALASLDERRELLGDRLRALETREEIFTAAARSQSAKAPRKSKSNPEPTAAIRQGTDLALARLEEVYRARRQTEKELKGVEARRAELARNGNVGGSVARIWLRERSGTVTVEYAVTDAAWKPLYDLRLDGTGIASVTLRALLPGNAPAMVIPALLTSAAQQGEPLPSAGDYSPVATYTLPVDVTVATSPVSLLHLTLTNSTTLTLPAGEGSCFWKGEFRGTAQLPVMAPGERKELVCGATPAVPAPPATTGKEISSKP